MLNITVNLRINKLIDFTSNLNFKEAMVLKLYTQLLSTQFS